MGLDKYTKIMATESANNDAEIHGFKIGSKQWKDSFEKYCEEATATMSIGRNNPYTMSNPSVQAMKTYFPEVFSENGISGTLAKNYTGEEMSTKAVEQRILLTVTNMVKLFEAGKLGNKVKGKNKSGSIENSEMSDFQLPKRPEGMSDEAYKVLSNKVLKRWITRDLLTAYFIDCLIPFFSMDRDDIQLILKGINIDEGTVREYQEGGSNSGRAKLIKALHELVKKEVSKVDLIKAVTG